tara:strand:+ start:662 stop:1516 length:855 start_codon:yes stop_codon:yes gene_type:complete
VDIQKIGVIGAGQMGAGIAHVAAISGYEVMLVDVSDVAIEKGLRTISKNMDRQVSKDVFDEVRKNKFLESIQTSTSVNDIENCDLVIEAASENESVKSSIFKDVCKVLKKESYIASNTSSISITKLASYTDRPEKFIGMHFMNPVPIMKLVEMIKGIATSKECYEDVVAVAEKMGKIVATSEDYPGFIVNRILMPMINEACFVLSEGIADRESIDQSMKLGTAHPMGPLELADFIGLDTCLAIMEVLYEGFADSKYRPNPLLRKYVDAGWLGKKTGKGFYDYTS